MTTVPAAELPSLLEDQVTHDLERCLVAVACRTDTITRRNSRALRRGERVRTSDAVARAAVARAGVDDGTRTAARRRPRLTSAGADDPPF